MKIKRVDTEVFILDVPEHNQYKDQLLKLIDEMPNTPHEKVSKTDWHLSRAFKRKYIDLFYSKVVRPSMGELRDYFKSNGWQIVNGWFQQYNN